ncbi:MAG: hypothetical protein H0X29_06185 [Parachlamydiaceae bacterium]|nr:hypothetical protein [Parachlamydiaceae bacterium]
MRNISKCIHFSIFLLISAFLLFSCSQRTLEDFRDEGEGVVRALTAELKKIRSRDDLLTHAPNLKKYFELLADIIIEASKYKETHPESELISPNKKEQSASDQLRIELNRVLHLDGGPEVIEKVQEEALNRLELFNKTTLKMTFSSI